MISGADVEQIIAGAISTLNLELPPDQRLTMSPSLVLFGVESKLDSLSLVSVVVDIESALRSKLGVDVSLTDERAMSREPPPFSTVALLRDYVLEVANGT